MRAAMALAKLEPNRLIPDAFVEVGLWGEEEIGVGENSEADGDVKKKGEGKEVGTGEGEGKGEAVRPVLTRGDVRELVGIAHSVFWVCLSLCRIHAPTPPLRRTTPLLMIKKLIVGLISASKTNPTSISSRHN